MRGTPLVPFLADTPAKWKVLSVICVTGSPSDCDAMQPTDSPEVCASVKRDLCIGQKRPANVTAYRG